MTTVIQNAPLGLDDYEPLDMKEKLWVLVNPETNRTGSARRHTKQRAIIMAVQEEDLYTFIRRSRTGRHFEPRQTTLGNILSKLPAKSENGELIEGIAIYSGYPYVARYIDAVLSDHRRSST